MKQATEYVGRRRYFEIFSSTNGVPGEYSVKMRGKEAAIVASFKFLWDIVTNDVSFRLGHCQRLISVNSWDFVSLYNVSLPDPRIFKVSTVFVSW